MRSTGVMGKDGRLLVFRGMLLLQGFMPVYYFLTPFDFSDAEHLINTIHYGIPNKGLIEPVYGLVGKTLESWVLISVVLPIVTLLALAVSYYVGLGLMWILLPTGRIIFLGWIIIFGFLSLLIGTLDVQHSADQAVGYVGAFGQGALVAMAYGGGLAWRPRRPSPPDKQAAPALNAPGLLHPTGPAPT